MSGFIAYHGVDAATHQLKVDELAPAGFRPVALNVSGDPGDARYSAVWLASPGPDWVAAHGLSADKYQTLFTELTDEGYAPSIVTATGPAGSEIYAAVFEQGVSGPWFARHGLHWGPETDPDTLTHENNRAARDGLVPRCLAVYGTPADRRFAGIWVRNTDAVLWSWWLIAPDAYQRFFNALVDGGMRPAALSVAPDGFLLAVFRGDQIGGWTARHGITAAEYQTEFEQCVAKGLRPIVIASGGAGAAARYAAVFAADDTPTQRRWSVTGPSFAGAGALDEAVRAFMAKYGIRAGTVAIGRGTAIVGARGYTWAESGYPVTQPEARFRIASLSKLFAAAEISRLVDAGNLAWDTKAFPFLGITSALPAGTPAAPGMDSITVEQLVLRTSRLPRDFDLDQREMAAKLGIGSAPISRDALLRYVYGRPLLGSVPAGGSYSNTAFYVLSSIVEKASGLPFVEVLERDVLRPLGILGDVSVAASAVGLGQAGEVSTYDNADVRSSLLDFAPEAMAPNAYGGDYVLETGAGSGGLLSSAQTIARVIARHPIWNADAAHLTGREVGTRYGTLEGTTSGATCRQDGLDFAFLFNRRVGDAEHDEIRDAINAVLTAHGRDL